MAFAYYYYRVAWVRLKGPVILATYFTIFSALFLIFYFFVVTGSNLHVIGTELPTDRNAVKRNEEQSQSFFTKFLRSKPSVQLWEKVSERYSLV